MKEKTITIPRTNKKVKAYFYSNKAGLFIAQANPFTGRLEINESKLSSYTKKTREFVLIHEYRHTKQSPIPIGWLLIGFSVLFFLLRSSLLVLLSIFIFIMALRWLLEIDANYYALQKVGPDLYLSAIKEIENKGKSKTILRKILIYFLQPPPLVFDLPTVSYQFRKRWQNR